MKTTLEIPDVLFRRAKSVAAQQGIPLRELISEALREKLRRQESLEEPWISSFDKLHGLPKETERIN